MTGEKGGLFAALRAEALKSRHAAPVRLAVLMALPMPLLGAMPYRGVQIFSAWNYWYALFLPVSLSLVVACVARADARTRMRGLLGLGFPLGRAWWAKALWCLALCALSNLVVFGIYLVGSAFSSQGLTAAGTLTMLLCALANTVTAAWMIHPSTTCQSPKTQQDRERGDELTARVFAPGRSILSTMGAIL